MPMKKYLLFVWIAVVFCFCNEDNFDISPMEADATCANIIDDEHFVSVSQASKVGSLFLNNNGNGNCVHTRNSSVVPEATSDKTAREIRTIYNENGVPCMYVINYESGGFVIVSATKNYYPILAYSETGSMNVEEAMKTGFSVWSEKTIQKIVESSSWGGDSQAEFQRMWVAYDKQEVEVAPLDALNDGVLFRQRMNELYELCPGYSFGPLTSARSFLSQSEYDSYVEKAELYGSPLEFTIVGYKRDPHERVGPLINTVWSQKSPFNGLCPQNCLAGCVAIAVAQIMRYHEWPATYNWSDMPNTTATIATQTLIADVGKAVDMEYGESASKSSIGKAALGFWAKGYNVELKEHKSWEVEDEIFINHRPVYMRGNQKEFMGFSWDGHAWVCEGAERWNTCANYFVEYLVNRSTNPSYSSCGLPAYWAPQRSSGSGYLLFYMNWGWGGEANAWYNFSDVDSEYGNFEYDRQNLYVYPKK